MPTFYEFFAGGGMARAGLGDDWECLFANDVDPKKAEAYAQNWGDEHLVISDVNDVATDQLPGRPDLAWASFPCQDLSLAGAGAGLRGERSGTFWPFWDLIRSLAVDDRAPSIIVLENVFGAVTSNGGRDFATLASALSESGFRFGALVMDAAHFVPQSRPRLFVIGVDSDIEIPDELVGNGPDGPWYPGALVNALEAVSDASGVDPVWWRVPEPPCRGTILSDLVEDEPAGVDWHSEAQTQYLVSLMTPVNRAKVEKALASGQRRVGGVYRRTRQGVQRAEVRLDDVAGCLRTPSGGSSRLTLLITENGTVRSRLLSPREGARLMGLPDDYVLPENYNAAYHLVGDGVVVDVVAHLTRHLLEPVLEARNAHNAPVHVAAA